MTHIDRILAALAHVWPLYVAFVLMLGLAYLAARGIDAASHWMSPQTDPRELVERGRERGQR